MQEPKSVYKALSDICKDFQNHLNSGGNPESAKPGSPRYFSGGSQPSSVIKYLEENGFVRVERWEPDYALGGQHPQFLVVPTEYGMGVLEQSRNADIYKATQDLARLVSEELGVSPDQLLGDLERNMQRVAGIRKSDAGKYRVLGIDKFDGSDWVESEYDTADDALRAARRLTRESMQLASGPDIATVFYAYDPRGRYLGGDVWKDE